MQPVTVNAAWSTAGHRPPRQLAPLWVDGYPVIFTAGETAAAQLLCGCRACRPHDTQGHNLDWSCMWSDMAHMVVWRTVMGLLTEQEVLDQARGA